jgi:hypothetical protein
MKAFKVRQIIIFIFAVLLVLTPIVMFISEDGFSIGGFKFNFLTWEGFMNPKHQEKKGYFCHRYKGRYRRGLPKKTHQ